MGFNGSKRILGLSFLLIAFGFFAMSAIASNGKWTDTQESLFMNWCTGGPSPNPIDISVFVSKSGTPLDEESSEHACTCLFKELSKQNPDPYFITRKEQGYRSISEGRKKDLVVLVLKDLLWEVKRIGKSQCSID